VLGFSHKTWLWLNTLQFYQDHQGSWSWREQNVQELQSPMISSSTSSGLIVRSPHCSLTFPATGSPHKKNVLWLHTCLTTIRAQVGESTLNPVATTSMPTFTTSLLKTSFLFIHFLNDMPPSNTDAPSVKCSVHLLLQMAFLNGQKPCRLFKKPWPLKITYIMVTFTAQYRRHEVNITSKYMLFYFDCTVLIRNKIVNYKIKSWMQYVASHKMCRVLARFVN